MERKRRKVYVGTVVSAVNDKTITVRVDSHRKHPIYGKSVKVTKKYAAHDEQNVAKVGDLVEIMETRPLSRSKHFRLVRVVREAVIV